MRLARFGLVACVLMATIAAAQTPTVPVTAPSTTNPLQRFTVGGRDLMLLDFAGTAVGDFPSNLQMLGGVMNVVDKGGVHMLRASAVSSFLITLPQPLPQDFTVEATLIPKVEANPEDIAFEGTPVINQGRNSANVMWHPNSIRATGGGVENFEAVLPEAIQKTAGRLTQVVMKVEGQTIKVYTNGRLLSTMPNRMFVRSRVLRVLLGGQDDDTQAVYLAQLRIVDNVAAVGPVAAGVAPGSQVAGSSAPTSPAVLPFQAAVRVPWGANLSWFHATGGVQYVLERSEEGQPFLVVGTFPDDPTGGFKADLQLKRNSHYDYRVKALDAGGAVLAVSATQGVDTPQQYPKITGLSTSSGPYETVTVGFTQPVSTRGVNITFTWDVAQLPADQWGLLDRIVTDPATGSTSLVRESPMPFRIQSGSALAAAAGTTVRFCVAVIPDPENPKELAAPTCVAVVVQ